MEIECYAIVVEEENLKKTQPLLIRRKIHFSKSFIISKREYHIFNKTTKWSMGTTASLCKVHEIPTKQEEKE